MTTEPQKHKHNKGYTGSTYVHSKEGSPHWVHDKFEAYSHGYEAKHNQNFKNKYRNPSKDFVLQLNNKTFTVSNFESIDRGLFASKLSEHLYRLKFDEETFLITKIKILNELNKQKSRHYDQKEYDGLLVKFLDLYENQ